MRKSKPPPTVSKAEFAKLIGVGNKQVDRYLREGVLDGRAVVRDGGKARIVPTIARRQLADRLAPPTSGRRLYGANAEADPGDRSLTGAIKSELLVSLRHRNRAAKRKLAAEAGHYARRADVEAALTRLPEMTLDAIEQSLPEMVDAVATAFSIPRERLAAMFDQMMMKLRTAAADLPSIGKARH